MRGGRVTTSVVADSALPHPGAPSHSQHRRPATLHMIDDPIPRFPDAHAKWLVSDV
jgi:hypothetical protein